jgi:hypothetical protein
MKVMQSLRQHAGLVVKWDLCLDGVYGKIHALGLSFLLLSVLPIRWFGRLKREGVDSVRTGGSGLLSASWYLRLIVW